LVKKLFRFLGNSAVRHYLLAWRVSGLVKMYFSNPRLTDLSPVFKNYRFLTRVHFVRLWRTSSTASGFQPSLSSVSRGFARHPFAAIGGISPLTLHTAKPLPALRQVYNKTLAAYLFNLIAACSGFMHSQALNNLF
jgi:hypothetical protein